MTRIKPAVTAHHRHKKTLARAKGYSQGRRKLIRIANETVMKGLAYAYRDRRARKGDMRLRIGDDAVYYPDVQVVCDPADTNQMFTTAPCVVVEVLSPSTSSIDLREKLMAYRRIERLRAYVIVFQDERRVLRHYRAEDDAWFDALHFADDSRVPFPCPEVDLSLADIYQGVEPLGD